MRTLLRTTLLLTLALLPALSRAEQKLGVVDFQRALNEVNKGKAAKALLKKDFDEKQKQLDAKKVEFDKLQADLEKQAAVMNDAAKRDRATELDRRARELQGLFVQLQKDLSEREQEATKGIYGRINTIVREIAEDDGYTKVVVDRAAVVFYPASADSHRQGHRHVQRPPSRGRRRRQEAGRGARSRAEEEVRGAPVASFTLAELAARVGGEAQGDAGLAVDGVASLEDAGPSQIPFFANRKYRKAFEASKAGAVIVEKDEDVPAGRTVLRASPAYLAFARISTALPPAPRAAARGLRPRRSSTRPPGPPERAGDAARDDWAARQGRAAHHRLPGRAAR